MILLQAIILGIIQGITEFLPISSSGHLILAPWFFNWPDPGLAFDVALHFGTLLAVLAYFWHEWLKLFIGFWQWASGKISWRENQEARLLVFLAVATIPGAIFGFLLESKAESVFRAPLLIVATMAIFGVILWMADKYGKKEVGTREISFKKSFFIGLAQALAIVPGVSRSGATISVGLLVGLKKESAAKFSFLLATPIILGASLLKMPEALREGVRLDLLAAVLAATISGFLAICFLMKFVQKRSYAIFVWYRILLAAAILIFVLVG